MKNFINKSFQRTNLRNVYQKQSDSDWIFEVRPRSSDSKAFKKKKDFSYPIQEFGEMSQFNKRIHQADERKTRRVQQQS